jgi:hypothetical protein
MQRQLAFDQGKYVKGKEAPEIGEYALRGTPSRRGRARLVSHNSGGSPLTPGSPSRTSNSGGSPTHPGTASRRAEPPKRRSRAGSQDAQHSDNHRPLGRGCEPRGNCRMDQTSRPRLKINPHGAASGSYLIWHAFRPRRRTRSPREHRGSGRGDQLLLRSFSAGLRSTGRTAAR